MDEQTREQEAASALLLDDVVKTYGAVRAVDGVSLAVRAGEFIALLGPNGAGKTTLFQLLSGLFAADSGRIVVMGHDMSRDPVPALAQLGIVFQQPTLDLELSVTANLMFHAGLHGIPRAVAAARIEKELARLGLAERAHGKAAQLSGGNRRRVELARALLHDPRVLLMDEPTVGLDPQSRSDLLRLMLPCARSARSPCCGRRICATRWVMPTAWSCCIGARCWRIPHRPTWWRLRPPPASSRRSWR